MKINSLVASLLLLPALLFAQGPITRNIVTTNTTPFVLSLMTNVSSTVTSNALAIATNISAVVAQDAAQAVVNQKLWQDVSLTIRGYGERAFDADKVVFNDGTIGHRPGTGYGNVYMRDFLMTREGLPERVTLTESWNILNTFSNTFYQAGWFVDSVDAAKQPNATPIIAWNAFTNNGSTIINPALDCAFDFTHAMFMDYRQRGNPLSFTNHWLVASNGMNFIGWSNSTLTAIPSVRITNDLVYLDKVALLNSPTFKWFGEFGFNDGIPKSGYSLWLSLLRFRALNESSEMAAAAGQVTTASNLAYQARSCSTNLITYLWTSTNWFLSCTITNDVADTIGSAFAVWIGAVDKPHALLIASNCVATSPGGVAFATNPSLTNGAPYFPGAGNPWKYSPISSPGTSQNQTAWPGFAGMWNYCCALWDGGVSAQNWYTLASTYATWNGAPIEYLAKPGSGNGTTFYMQGAQALSFFDHVATDFQFRNFETNSTSAGGFLGNTNQFTNSGGVTSIKGGVQLTNTGLWGSSTIFGTLVMSGLSEDLIRTKPLFVSPAGDIVGWSQNGNIWTNLQYGGLSPAAQQIITNIAFSFASGGTNLDLGNSTNLQYSGLSLTAQIAVTNAAQTVVNSDNATALSTRAQASGASLVGADLFTLQQEMALAAVETNKHTIAAGPMTGTNGWSPASGYSTTFFLRDFNYAVRADTSGNLGIGTNYFSVTDLTNAFHLFVLNQNADRSIPDAVVFSTGAGNGNTAYDNSCELVDLLNSIYSRNAASGLLLYTNNLSAISNAMGFLNLSNNVVCITNSTTVGWGFEDSVKMTNRVSMATVLRYRALKQLASLESASGGSGASNYLYLAAISATNLETFLLDSTTGLLRGADIGNTQYDIPANCLALKLGTFTTPAKSNAAVTAILSYLPGGTNFVAGRGILNSAGGVRHLPVGQNWTSTTTPPGAYQNGGFWTAFNEWLLPAISPVATNQARTIFAAVVQQAYNESNGLNEWYDQVGYREGVDDYVASLCGPLTPGIGSGNSFLSTPAINPRANDARQIVGTAGVPSNFEPVADGTLFISGTSGKVRINNTTGGSFVDWMMNGEWLWSGFVDTNTDRSLHLFNLTSGADVLTLKENGTTIGNFIGKISSGNVTNAAGSRVAYLSDVGSGSATNAFSVLLTNNVAGYSNKTVLNLIAGSNFQITSVSNHGDVVDVTLGLPTTVGFTAVNVGTLGVTNPIPPEALAATNGVTDGMVLSFDHNTNKFVTATGGGGFTGNPNQFDVSGSVTNIKSGAFITNAVFRGNATYFGDGGWSITNGIPSADTVCNDALGYVSTLPLAATPISSTSFIGNGAGLTNFQFVSQQILSGYLGVSTGVPTVLTNWVGIANGNFTVGASTDGTITNLTAGFYTLSATVNAADDSVKWAIWWETNLVLAGVSVTNAAGFVAGAAVQETETLGAQTFWLPANTRISLKVWGDVGGNPVISSATRQIDRR